jgi:phosphoglycerate dehydrogenase-like enzyme
MGAPDTGRALPAAEELTKDSLVMTAAAPIVVVLYGDHRPPGMAEVEAAADVRYATAEQLPEALPGADALFVWDFLSTAVANAWPHADRLRWVHIAAAGVDPLMFPDLVRSPVVVTNSRGIFDRPIAEYVLGLILAFAKDLPGTLDLQRERLWRHRETERIDQQRALVVGTGSIGRTIGRLLSAAGMTVTGVGRRSRSADPDLGEIHASAELPSLLPAADYVVVAAPLTDQTRGLFDAAAFVRMKPTARLINIGRGPIVVEEALATALHERQIAGAALDVFAEEPLPRDNVLWSAPNLIISPHMSGDFVGWLDTLADLFVENFRRWLAGDDLLNVVDKDLGYVRSSS